MITEILSVADRLESLASITPILNSSANPVRELVELATRLRVAVNCNAVQLDEGETLPDYEEVKLFAEFDEYY